MNQEAQQQQLFSEDERNQIIDKLIQIRKEFAPIIAQFMAERNLHPVLMAQLLASESCAVTWCGLMEATDATNDDIRGFWSQLVDRIRDNELSEAALQRNREFIEKAIAEAKEADGE